MILSWLRQKFLTGYPGVESDILVPPDPKLGDYSSNIAFILAKKEKKSPMEVGQSVIAKLQDDKDIQLMFDRIEVVSPGFINFTLRPNYMRRQLVNIHSLGARYGRGIIGKGKKVIIEFSSPNIAKPMHIGHIRTTILGDVLANIFETLGYGVIRWNYLGDWGTQFGKLIVAYKRWGKKEDVERAPIDTLLSLYVRFHEELKTQPDIETEGQKEFQKLEEGDLENRKLWEWFKEESLKEFKNIYEILRTHFDIWDGESNYRDELQPLIEVLKEQGIAKESEGAFIVDLESVGLPAAILQKSDGASVYLTREIATLQSRLEEHQPDKMLYVVGNEQSLHFQQLFAVAKLLGLDSAELVHVKYGLILSESGQKMATREGRTVALTDVLEKAMTLARKAVAEKNPSLSPDEQEDVSREVGLGALKYNVLMDHRNSDITFDWDKMLDFSGNSGPYLQYTYARLASIRRKAGGAFFRKYLTPNLKLLEHELELRLMRHLLDYPEVIRRSSENYTTNEITLYLYELANLVNRYYEEVRVLDDKTTRDARVFLIESVMGVLRSGLSLLGIKTLERM